MIREFSLLPVSPNPSRGMAYVAWSVPRESRLRLTVHDVQGRQVAVLADGIYTNGRHVMRWNTLGELDVRRRGCTSCGCTAGRCFRAARSLVTLKP